MLSKISNSPASVFAALVILSIGTPSTASASDLENTVTATSKPTRVILLAVDGLSKRGLEQAQTPRLDELAQQGVFIRRSKGVLPTKSSPNWTSILTGSWPEDHGIHSNQWWWFRWHRRLRYPTLFTSLREQAPRKRSAAVYEWKHFGRLWAEKDLDRAVCSQDSAKTVSRVKRTLEEVRPDFLVVHLLRADLAGHEHGWGSAAYLTALRTADAQIGEIVDKVKALGLHDETLFIVASDHGGTGKKHGGTSETELYTPVIFVGASIKAKQVWEKPINNVDISQTIASILGVKLKGKVRGRVLTELWDGSQ